MNHNICLRTCGRMAAILLCLLLLGPVWMGQARAEETTYVSLRLQLPEAFQGISFVLRTESEDPQGAYTVEADGLLNLYVPGAARYVLTSADPELTLPEPGDSVLRGKPAGSEAGAPITISVDLGPAWAGVLFDCATDTGSYPGTFAVDSDGILTVSLEESRIYSLSPAAAVDAYGIAPEEDTSLAGTEDSSFTGEEEASELPSESSPADPEEERTEAEAEETGTDGAVVPGESEQDEPSAPEDSQESGARKNRSARIFFFAVLALLAVGFVVSKIRRARQTGQRDPEEEEDE